MRVIETQATEVKSDNSSEEEKKDRSTWLGNRKAQMGRAKLNIAKKMGQVKDWSARQWKRLPWALKLLVIIAACVGLYIAWYVLALYTAMISLWLFLAYLILTVWLFMLVWIKWATADEKRRREQSGGDFIVVAL